MSAYQERRILSYALVDDLAGDPHNSSMHFCIDYISKRLLFCNRARRKDETPPETKRWDDGDGGVKEGDRGVKEGVREWVMRVDYKVCHKVVFLPPSYLFTQTLMILPMLCLMVA